MLFYNKEDNKILNLDNVVRIGIGGNLLIFNPNDIVAWGIDGNQHLICKCKNAEEASKIINNIYTKMTYASGNMILDLEEFREPEKNIYEETDSIKTETGRTREEIREDGNEEK